MEDKINEEVICVLVYNKPIKKIEVDYVPIHNPLAKPLRAFDDLCGNTSTTLDDIISFIQRMPELNQLNAQYKYCVSLNSAYQGFKAHHEETINQIRNRQQLMLLSKKQNPNTYDLEEKTEEFKQELKRKYEKWGKAYAINKAYRLCHEDKKILTFSHRICGWSNPVYKLTPNFSIEIKTNFGYGHASYFYTKLKYKSIEITPFSEWIEYEFAKVAEIVRYSKSHNLENEYWLEAMTFAKEACNLSMADEEKFVEKYVVDECEKMVKGLEEIFNQEQFSFKKRGEKGTNPVAKEGHSLIEFRGEKISGALDFISKILELEKIAAIKSFISRIENCNKRIQPILVEELEVLKIKLENLNAEMAVLKPEYLELSDRNANYQKHKKAIQNQLIESKRINPRDIDIKQVDREFLNRFPEFKEFEKEFKEVSENYRVLSQRIRNLQLISANIRSCNEKILQYFGSATILTRLQKLSIG